MRDRALVGRSLQLALLFQLNFLNCGIDNLLHKLMGFAVFHFVVVYLSSIRQDHIRLLGASSILDLISTSDTLSVLYNMMLCGCVLHVNKTSCGRNLGLIKHLGRLIKLVLENILQLLSCILRTLDIFHFFPNVLNVQVHHIVLIL